MRWLVFVLILLYATPAHTEEQCTKQIYTDREVKPDFNCPGPGEEGLLPKLELKKSVALELKQPAPWAGILLDRGRVLTLGLRVKALRRLRWEDMMYCGEMAGAEVDYVEQSGQIEVELRTSQRDSYKQQVVVLEKERDRLNSWYRSPILWFSVGVVVTAAGTVAAVYATK